MRVIKEMLSGIESKTFDIGFVGEKNHTCVMINCVSLFKQYPDAVATMVARPPVGDIYPVVLHRDGVFVVWNVSESDIANAGSGQYQLTFTDGEGDNAEIIKTVYGSFSVKPSMVSNGEAPDPIEDWLEEANEALAEFGKINELSASATTLAPGQPATAEITTVSGHKNIAIGVPKGDKGDKGDQGDPAPSDQVIPAVNSYLAQVITNPDSPPLDRNLSSNVSAAPADMVGDLKSALNEQLTETNKTAQLFAEGKIMLNGIRMKGYYINYQGYVYVGSAQEIKLFELVPGVTYILKMSDGNTRRFGLSNSEPTNGLQLVDFHDISGNTYEISNTGNYKYLYVNYTNNAGTTPGDAYLTSDQNYYATKTEVNTAISTQTASMNGKIDVLCNKISDDLTYQDGYVKANLSYISDSGYQTSSLFELESGETVYALIWAYINVVSAITVCDSTGTPLSVGALGSNASQSAPKWYEYTNNTTSKQYIKVSFDTNSGKEIFKTNDGMSIARQLIATGGATPKTVLYMGDSLTALRDYPSIVNDGNTNINVAIPGATLVTYPNDGANKVNRGISFVGMVTAMCNNDVSLQEEIVQDFTTPQAITDMNRFIALEDNFDSIDTIVFWFGMNDYLRNKAIGTIDETDYQKVVPALNYCLNLLSTNFPTVSLYCIGNSYTNRVATSGLSIQDYINAIKGVCETYGVPFYDMLHLGGVNAVNYEDRLEDGIHQNATQNVIVAEKVRNFIKE